jgi:hypothetical protein
VDKKKLFEISGISANNDFETIKNKLMWLTSGRTGKEKKWVKLIDCDTEHLENIIYNVPTLYPITKRVILSILHDRWKKEKLSLIEIQLKINKWRKEGYSVDGIEKMYESVGHK